MPTRLRLVSSTRFLGARGWALASAVLALTAFDSPARAVSYYLATDVPASLGGADYTTNQIVRSVGAAYVLQVTLPSGTEMSALHRRPDGVFLFSPAQPATLGGADYESQDVVSYDGLLFALFLDGSAEGIPPYARIDALFLDPATGNPVLSFDVPVTLGAATYGRSDLVSRTGLGVFALFWDAEPAGVPDYANVVGADEDTAGTLVLSFDVPTRLGAIEFLPGQLVQWAGGAFASYFVDAAWPAAAQLRDFSFVPPDADGAGRVADDGCLPAGVSLTVDRNPVTGDLTLNWGASCLATDTDYEIYESAMLGPISGQGFYSHASRFCSSGGALSLTFPPLAPAAPAIGSYYLVVPRNAIHEGSYGRSSTCAERPVGAASCEAQQIGACP